MSLNLDPHPETEKLKAGETSSVNKDTNLEARFSDHQCLFHVSQENVRVRVGDTCKVNTTE